MSQRFDMSVPDKRALGISAATSAARRGELVVLPLESSYGIAADAFNPTGTASLTGAKGRGRDLALPVLIGSPSTAEGLLMRTDARLKALFEAFWPGPLTVVAACHPTLNWDLGDNQGVVAVRMPVHPVALELLREVGPMAVATANVLGKPPAQTCADAMSQFSGLVRVYLDSGPSPALAPSTVVDATGEVLRVVREGAFTMEDLRSVVPGVAGPED